MGMDKKSSKTSGMISRGISAAMLQLNTMFDEAGGDKALELLDLLAELPAPAREAFFRATIPLAREYRNMKTDSSVFEKDLLSGIEEDLFNDVEPRSIPIPDRSKNKPSLRVVRKVTDSNILHLTSRSKNN